MATFAAPLSREGPGLLLRDLGRDDPQIDAVIGVIAQVSPDILLLTDFDFDAEGFALAAFAKRLADAGVDLSWRFALPPNSGEMTALDLDRNGRLGEARDAQGYGTFAGDGGMALLSRLPIDTAGVQDLSGLLWRDIPGATLPTLPDGGAWPEDLQAIQKLSTTGHWIVPVTAPSGPFHLLAFSATPPVFDGPEDRNGLRNRDELGLWALVMAGAFGPAPEMAILAGNTNLDPVDGDGLSAAMRDVLGGDIWQDPQPRSAGGARAADPGQSGDPALDTADWPFPDGPGNLRVSYVLPSRAWRVLASGVFWPAQGESGADILGPDGMAAGPHRLVWVDIAR